MLDFDFDCTSEASEPASSTPTSSIWESNHEVFKGHEAEVASATTVLPERKPPAVAHVSLFVETLRYAPMACFIAKLALKVHGETVKLLRTWESQEQCPFFKVVAQL